MSVGEASERGAHAATAHALRLTDVERRFGGLWALKSVSFAVERGERRAILGPNGAGKTTLFNVIAGDIRPTAGRIALFGVEVSHLPPHRRARCGLARTYQAAHSFGGLSVNDNVLLALRGTKRGRMSLWPWDRTDGQRERARRLAAQVGLPHAHDTLAATLSHGEGRLLELAMALAGEPRIIMLDEPAAGLAPDERSRLTDLLLGLDPAITLLLIEHDMDVALSVANIVTVMNGGTVLATGTPHEIRTSQAVHDLYLGVAGG